MYKIDFDTKDYIRIMESLSKCFSSLLIEINKDGLVLKNVGNNADISITVTISEKDIKEFEFDNKSSVFITLPFHEFSQATKKIKLPIIMEESGKSKIRLRSGSARFDITKENEDPDLYNMHSKIVKDHTSKGAHEIALSSGDFIEAISYLEFTKSDVKFMVEKKMLKMVSEMGSLEGEFEFETDVDDELAWEDSFNIAFFSMLRNILPCSKDLKLYIREAENDDDPVPASIIEFDVGPNSNISIVMVGQKPDANIPGIVGEDDSEEDENDFVFEDDKDTFYDEEGDDEV